MGIGRTAVGMVLTAVAAWAGAADNGGALPLIERGTLAMRADPDESRRDAEKALDLLRDHPDGDLEIRAHLILCDYYSERDDAAAHREFAAASDLLPRAQRHGLRAGALTCRGETRETAGDYAAAKADFDEAVGVATEAADEPMLADALFSRGYLRAVQGEFAAGMSDVRRSQELFERIDMPQHALTVMNTIAMIYNRMGDYQHAADIYERARAQQHEGGLRRDEAVTLYNLGRARQKLREWEAARRDFSGCLALSRDLDYVRGETYGLLGLAAVDNATNDANGALAELDKAAALPGPPAEARLNAQLHLERGIALAQLHRGSEAMQALKQSEAVFLKANSLDELLTTYNQSATVEATLGDWQNAYLYSNQAQAVSEKLLHNQLDQRFATLKIEFDTAAKEEENKLLTSQNEANEKALEQERRGNALQNTVILMSFGVLALLIILVLYQRRGGRRMRNLAMTDELTGAPNRRATLAELQALLQREDGPRCSILILDIDHFKTINDEFGHPAGDATLQALTATLRDAVAEPAMVGRLGGEEFMVVLGSVGLHDACLIAEHIRMQVPQIDLTPQIGARRITVSIGVAASTHGDTVSSLLSRADAALYAAKHAGRDCVRTDRTADVKAPAEAGA